jgi:outer membrane protein assembly factor BamB
MVAGIGLAAGQVGAADWPQWRGPRQDGISDEAGLAGQWPEKGPAELWRAPLGQGFSAVSVAGGRAFTMYAAGEGEVVTALDIATGKVLWKTQSGPLFESSYGNGPRATPTVDEGRVYTLGAAGPLLCLDAQTGAKLWGFNVLEKFGAENLEFGLSASPAVFGKMLVVVVGGKNGKSLVALDKTTGDVLWTSLDDKAGYSTPLRIEVQGVPQIVVLTGQAVVGVSPDGGRELWRHPWKTTLDANVATPIVRDNRLFISTGYGTGCGLFELTAAGGRPAARLLWANKNMKNYFATSVLLDGHLYGFDNTMLVCMDFQTGDVKWRERGFNRGSVLAAGKRLIVYGERATLALADASPEKYKEIARATVLGDKTWTIPTLAGGKLFVRNEKEIVCLKVAP